ncbi:RNA polymerase sigma factor, sigma-70 family [Algoriphagus alkaliphilus]|uniref:RNA polymerase sigma factor, sigma-70 family n=1 Tax=Algoriphagus alkaliphilus TaxID=279824 RepID=A0A1G5VDI6_9BACT|nr:sigma-70 family RNA polymerase sigma factor [Algoriphagus alkaliphilus]MBA4299706.1 sigma-70 family RNA polymerase sigma factor [Cyclobacterium sp.]SDA43297.1 RNA polymerase sigma factor, sigma-70 family [Algoriphagus alkaliphilus]
MRSEKADILVFSEFDEMDLWLQLKRGEKGGLAGIYSKYSSDLFRYGMAVKPNRSFIKDCIQELFIDLWKYRDTLSQTDNVRVYLIRCLSNRINKEITREKKLISESEISAFETVFMEESVEDRLIDFQRDQDLHTKLKKGLEKLPARQREVIQLIFFEKQGYEESSKIMGINVDSCYTLAWKAIKSLKKSIILAFFLMIVIGI